MFLVVALSSDDGTGALAGDAFAVIGWGDYADGIAARLTGQYSRLGALMDPVTDRLLVSRAWSCAGTSSCCPAGRSRCSAARELLMLALGAYGRGAGWSCASTGPGGWRSRP